jgi:hypothetical protein
MWSFLFLSAAFLVKSAAEGASSNVKKTGLACWFCQSKPEAAQRFSGQAVQLYGLSQTATRGDLSLKNGF